MNLLTLLIFNSFAIIGFWYACSYEIIRKTGEPIKIESKIFGGIHHWLNEKGYFKSLKPICGCPVCMSSVHGTWFFLAFIHTGVVAWATWVLALAGLMTIYVHRGIIKTWMV